MAISWILLVAVPFYSVLATVQNSVELYVVTEPTTSELNYITEDDDAALVRNYGFRTNKLSDTLENMEKSDKRDPALVGTSRRPISEKLLSISKCSTYLNSALVLGEYCFGVVLGKTSVVFVKIPGFSPCREPSTPYSITVYDESGGTVIGTTHNTTLPLQTDFQLKSRTRYNVLVSADNATLFNKSITTLESDIPTSVLDYLMALNKTHPDWDCPNNRSPITGSAKRTVLNFWDVNVKPKKLISWDRTTHTEPITDRNYIWIVIISILMFCLVLSVLFIRYRYWKRFVPISHWRDISLIRPNATIPDNLRDPSNRSRDDLSDPPYLIPNNFRAQTSNSENVSMAPLYVNIPNNLREQTINSQNVSVAPVYMNIPNKLKEQTSRSRNVPLDLSYVNPIDSEYQTSPLPGVSSDQLYNSIPNDLSDRTNFSQDVSVAPLYVNMSDNSEARSSYGEDLSEPLYVEIIDG